MVWIRAPLLTSRVLPAASSDERAQDCRATRSRLECGQHIHDALEPYEIEVPGEEVLPEQCEGTVCVTTPQPAPVVTEPPRKRDGTDHIVLGFAEAFGPGSPGVGETAERVGGRHLMGDPNWRDTLLDAAYKSPPKTKFTVSLDGFEGTSTYSKVTNAVRNAERAEQRHLRDPDNAGLPNNTEWELMHLYYAGRMPEVDFVEDVGRRRVANPF